MKTALTAILLAIMSMQAGAGQKRIGQYGCFHGDMIYGYTYNTNIATCPPLHTVFRNPAASAHPHHGGTRAQLIKDKQKPVHRHDPETCPLSIRWLGD